MIEFLPDPEALFTDLGLDLGDEIAASGDQLGAGTIDPALGAPDLAVDPIDLPSEPDPFLDPTEAVVTETMTSWAFGAEIPLPDPFGVAAAAGGLVGSARRRRARKAAERQERVAEGQAAADAVGQAPADPRGQVPAEAEGQARADDSA
jgi:hypothetical protein